MPLSTFANGLVHALNYLNASTMATLVGQVPEIFELKLASTSSGSGSDKHISSKQITLLAPLNEAFHGSGISQLSTSDLQDLLNYHILDVWIPNRNGRYVSPSLLTRYTDLPHSHPTQSLIVDVNGSFTTIVTPLSRLCVQAKSSYMHLHIWTIPQLIQIPEDFFNTLSAMKMDQVADFVSSAFLAHVIRGMTGVTAFVPTSQAFYEHHHDNKQNHQDNKRDIALRHFSTNRTLIYSSDLVDGMSLETLYGTCVAIVNGLDGRKKVVGNDGYTTANILRTDILLSNGVIHIIDKVL
ncbi:hypothetical protein E3P98_03585 [Wallemia ichthyophaga]|nr:hypothetical protein E3P98_03585 [Wallemia ichthyophaga]